MRKSTHSAEYAELRARLTTLREAAGLSQRALAERLGLPHTWVAKVESGERRIDLVEFAWFCSACNAAPSAEASRLISNWSPIRAAAAQKRGGRR